MTTGVRVIAGKWRGRRLTAPSGLATRPIPDRVKQSLFDTLGQSLDGQRVIDVCSGSGSFGIEAGSRGAAEDHLIEEAPAAAEVITHNIHHVGEPSELILHQARYEDTLPSLTGFDLVFCDPPFPWFRDDPKRISAMLNLAAECITPEGLVLIRGEMGTKLPPTSHGLHMRDWKEYGRSWVAFLEIRKED
ncbi:MAG: RsmD family RNA methyltransferase [Planctomycetota bacterium]|nr:RsmD family RNA methyltransferase [Planctomycetota bacterium]